MIIVKTPQELAKMRVSCRMVAEILHELSTLVVPGVTTWDLDRLAEESCLKRNAVPAFKGYGGFPCSICASPNNTVVHGFATKEPLSAGDIVSIDFGVLYDGFYGDSAVTLPVGAVDDDKKRLMDVTKASLVAGIKVVAPGVCLSDVSSAVQVVAEAAGFSVVREFVGHGIGRSLHEDPQIPNYGKAGFGPKLKAGMVLAIEPMVNAGTHHVQVLGDGWTAVTRDGRSSAHFEHSVAVTEDGAEILTRL
ncbi:MAG: type I methionyl aminopeptidase [Desulfuromonas sp.]|nr:type I methionyl aminopeptidase [Desulfuromonas sp.]